MDSYSLAKILERLAKRDQFDGVGRVLLSELNDEVGECITSENVLRSWQKHNPEITIEQRTSNVILIFFENSHERTMRMPIGGELEFGE